MRKNKKLYLGAAVIISLSLFLSGCLRSGGDEKKSGTISVYRVLSDDKQAGGALISAEEISLPQSGDPLYFALKEVVGASKSQGMKGAFPQDVTFISYSINDTELSVVLSEEYKSLSGMEKSLADYCLTFTLCEAEEIEAISVYAQDELITSGLSPEDAVLYDSEANPLEKQLKLYYAYSGGRYLGVEYHGLTVDEDVSLERYVIDELLRGPKGENLYSAIPQETALIDVHTENGICRVALSGEFIDDMPETIMGQRLAVYSIVNSLTSLAEIEEVQIIIDGRQEKDYGHLPIDGALERNELVNGPPSAAKGEKDLSLYLVTADGESLAAIPYIIGLEDHETIEEKVLEILVDHSAQPGFLDIFPQGLGEKSVSIRSGVCTIDLPKEFYEHHGKAGTLDVALASISSSVISAGTASQVKFLSQGETPVYRGKSYGGRFEKNTELVIK